MFRTTAALVLIGASLTSTPSLAARTATVKETFYGCILKSSAERAWNLFLKKDDKAVARELAVGRCSRIAANQTVEFYEYDFDVSCIRPKGEPRCLWFPSQWIAR